jgi:hypothetical protein
MHHRIVSRPTEQLIGQHACIRVNRIFLERDIIGGIPICFGPELQGDTADTLHFSVGAVVSRQLSHTHKNWWRDIGIGVTGGLAFVSELGIAFDFSGDGGGSAGVDESATASVDTDDTSVSFEGSSDFVSGTGNFSGNASGNSTFRFGFGIHLGVTIPLGPFIVEGGMRYDYIHRRYPTGYIDLGVRLPRIR